MLLPKSFVYWGKVEGKEKYIIFYCQKVFIYF